MHSSSLIVAAIITLTFWSLPSSNANVFAQTRTNGKIAFSQVTAGSDSQIYLVSDDGSGSTRIPVNCYKNIQPRWSPDGTKIVFTSSCPDGNDEIYTMNADGSRLRRLTNNPAIDEFPAWSPDGTKIAFSSNRGWGAFHIYLMNADGTEQRMLTPRPGGEGTHPAWSSEGTRIAFSFISLGGNYEIYVINVDGTELINITNNSGQDYHPSWSPDDSKIVFSSLRNQQQNIYVMDADGSNQTRITFTDTADLTPCWSPDGTKIAFSSISLSSRNDDIYAMNRDGSNLVRVTSSPLHDMFPSWQPKLAPSFTPTLITEAGTDNALALDSSTLTRDPFHVTNANNLSQDQRTRVMLFAVYTELMPGEDASAVTAQAEDSQHRIYPLTVEFVGRVPSLAWLTQVNVRLPEELAGAGDVMVSIGLRGTTSNKALLRIN